MTMQFTDSNAANFELVKELVAGMPESAQRRARKAGGQIVDIVEKLKREYPNDPAIAVGAAFAVFFMAENLIQPNGDNVKSDGDTLIQLI